MPAPNERYTEILFIHHFISALQDPVEFYPPSTREEYLAGYDAKIVGQGLKELYLQFKRPEVEILSRDFRIPLTAHQHKRLLDCLHPQAPGSVYYVSHTFTSIHRLNEMIRQLTRPTNLLVHYLAFPIAAFSDQAQSIHYGLSSALQQGLFGRSPMDTWYERGRDGNVGPTHPILRCDRLLDDFRRGETGTLVYGAELAAGKSESPLLVEDSQVGHLPAPTGNEGAACGPGTSIGEVSLRNDHSCPSG
jgi:hypothetical protein